jgi:hypothetical protein
MPKKLTKKTKTKVASKKATGTSPKHVIATDYPGHSLDRVLKIPQAIIDNNAGNECSADDLAQYMGKARAYGPFRHELSSCYKFGLIEKPTKDRVKITALAERILRPENEDDKIKGLRESVITCPIFGEIYAYYRGNALPKDEFFSNALIKTFNVPSAKLEELKKNFIESLESAGLIEEKDGKHLILDDKSDELKNVLEKVAITNPAKKIDIDKNDTCFVMMPFSSPHGDYYKTIFKPAIEKAGLTPRRADDDIFATGKIMEQIWSGIQQAKVLIAELTSRNPNVFYELGIAHALDKPVVLISSNQEDVPFDLQHIRVIYYDINDPFWGNNLIEKIAEYIISALKDPESNTFAKQIKLS